MGLGAGIGSLFGGLTSILGGNAKANAATQAGNIQAGSAQQGINELQGLLGGQQQNQQPFISAGQTSLGQLMSAIQSGQFTNGPAPQYTGGAFQAPTAAQAQATPGYQFTQQQGSKGILQGAAAAGGAISGGTLKALDSFNSGLASNTYQQTFNNALSGYGAGLQQYQAQLQGYGAQMQGNQANFNQLFQPAQLGETAANSLNGTETQQGENIASEYNNQGNALAAGLIGSTNQQWGGIQAGINQLFPPQRQQGYRVNPNGGYGGGPNSYGGLMSMWGGGGSSGGQSPMVSGGGWSSGGSPSGSASSTFNPVEDPGWTGGLGGGGIG